MSAYRFDLVTKAISQVPGLAADGVHTSLLADQLFVVDGTAVKPLGAGAVQPATWKSKRFYLPWPDGFGWVRVNGPAIEATTVRYYLDGVLAHTAIFSSRAPQRLPARRGHHIELEIEGPDRVTSLSIAKAAEELSP